MGICRGAQSPSSCCGKKHCCPVSSKGQPLGASHRPVSVSVGKFRRRRRAGQHLWLADVKLRRIRDHEPNPSSEAADDGGSVGGAASAVGSPGRTVDAGSPGLFPPWSSSFRGRAMRGRQHPRKTCSMPASSWGARGVSLATPLALQGRDRSAGRLWRRLRS